MFVYPASAPKSPPTLSRLLAQAIEGLGRTSEQIAIRHEIKNDHDR